VKCRWYLAASLLLSVPCAERSLAADPDAAAYVNAIGFERQRDYEQAFEWYRKSFEAGESVPGWRSPEQMAFDLATKRLTRFEEGVQVLEAAIERAPRAELYFDLAEFYFNRVKEYATCRPYYQKAYEYYLRENNYRYASRCLRVLARSYSNEEASMDYYDKIKVRKRYPTIMRDLYLRALELNDKVPPQWQAHEKYHAYEDLADIYANKWFEGYDLEKSKEYFDLAQIAAGKTEKVSDNSARREQLQRLMRAKNYDEAIPLAEQCLKETPDSPWLHSQLMEAFEAKGDLERALAESDKAIELLNQGRSKLRTDREKLAAHRRRFASFTERGTYLAMKMKRYDKAFDTMEMVKARALLDLMASKDTTSRNQSIAEEIAEREALLAEMDEVKKQIQAEQGTLQSEDLASLQRSLVLIEDKTEVLRARIETSRREMESLRAVSPLSCQETQAMVEDFTLVSFVHPESIAILTRDSVIVRTVRGSTRLPGLYEQYLKALQIEGTTSRGLDLESSEPGDQAAEAVAKSLEHAQAMYDICLRPIEKYLKTDLVYILPDGWYNPIPFQALHDGEKFFVEKHTVAYAPSASVLKLCMDKRKPFSGRILALGNPNLKDARFRLNYAEEEVMALGDLYPDSRVLVRDEASEKAVRLLAADAGALHFACHGSIDFDEPLHSSLRLSPDETNDGFLHAYEIFDLNLQASIVTLSACESGLGKNRRENEVLGLPRAWFFAGVPTVVASLWKVDDRATARLMVDFYRNLESMDKATALRTAQLKMIQEKYSPYHWGAFCLYGDYM